MVKSDTPKAIEFIKKYSDEFIVLTAIIPDGPTETRTFKRAGGFKGLKAWIDKQQGKKNLYFNVNPVKSPTNKKTSKSDIKSLAWLHVDVDPEKRKDLKKEREKILNKIKSFSPSPSLIIDSGGGYQAFWKLEEPIQITNESEIPTLESYNKQLEILFKADHCHNIDRIMRLPGTINLPNKSKIKKGRTPVLSKLIEFPSNVYPITDFSKAPTIEKENVPKGEYITSLGDLPTEIDISKLPVNEKIKSLILDGPTDDYESRSEAVFAVCCSLVRADVDEQIIGAILLNKDFKISESVLESKRPERTALRQINRAKEFAVAPELEELNSQYAFVIEGGKARIIQEYINEEGEKLIKNRFAPTDFQIMMANRFVDCGKNSKGDIIYQKLGKWWLEHPKRRTFDTVEFMPGMDGKNGTYNLWRGFKYEAIPGNWELMKQHIFKIICQKDKKNFEYLMNWMARCIQKPNEAGEIAVVVTGKQGTGKGLFIRSFGLLFGQHFKHISTSRHLTGNFNDHLRDCILLFADEAIWGGDIREASALKRIITEPTLTIEPKGLPVISCPNYIHLMMASNNDWVIHAEHDERRFFVLEASDEKQGDQKYFAKLQECMDKGGYEAMFHELLNMNIENFRVRDFPQTEWLFKQKEISMNAEIQYFSHILNEGDAGDGSWDEIDSQVFYDNYLVFCQEIKIRKPITKRGLFEKFKKIFHYVEKGKVYPYSKPYRGMKKVPDPLQPGKRKEVAGITRKYILPPLGKCRDLFDKFMRMKQEWEQHEGDDVENETISF